MEQRYYIIHDKEQVLAHLWHSVSWVDKREHKNVPHVWRKVRLSKHNQKKVTQECEVPVEEEPIGTLALWAKPKVVDLITWPG